MRARARQQDSPGAPRSIAAPPSAHGSWDRRIVVVVILAGVIVAAITLGPRPDSAPVAADNSITGFVADNLAADEPIGLVGEGTVPAPHRAVVLRTAADVAGGAVDWVLIADLEANGLDDGLLAWVADEGRLVARSADGAALYDVRDANQAAPPTPDAPAATVSPTTTTMSPTTSTSTTSTGPPPVTEASPTTEVPPATEIGRPDGPAPQPPILAERTHGVVAGESFWTIAEAEVAEVAGRAPLDAEVTSYWASLVRANESRLVEPGNPDYVLPGQILVLPAGPVMT